MQESASPPLLAVNRHSGCLLRANTFRSIIVSATVHLATIANIPYPARVETKQGVQRWR